MAIKIPQYTDQTQAQGLLDVNGWPHANPVDTPAYIGKGIESLGNAGVSFATVVAQQQSQARVVDSLKGISDDQLQWTKNLNEAINGAPDNGAGMTDRVLGDYDKYWQGKVAGVQDPALKKHLTEQYVSLRNTLWHSGLTTEFKAAQSDKYNKFEDTFRNLQGEVQSGSKTPDQAKTEMDTLLANSGLAVDTRNALALNYRERLGGASLQGEIARNPNGVQRQLETNLGVRNSYYDMTEKGESSGNLTIVNPKSGATGLYQFMPDTWAAARKAVPGLPENIQDATREQQRAAMEWFTGNNAKSMAGDLGRQPTNGELRLAHYFGAKGAVALLGVDPNTKFTDLPQDFWQKIGAKFSNDTLIAQNPNLKDKTVGAVIGGYRQQFDGGMVPSQTVQQAVAMIPPDKLSSWIDVARGESNRQMATARAQVESLVNDHTAMFMQGATVNQPLTANDFNRAFGDIEGPRRFSAYQFDMQTGADVQAMKTMPTEQQQAFLDQHKPQPNTPNYAWQTSRYDALVKANNLVNQERGQDPIGWAVNNGIGNVGRLDMSSADNFGKQLAQRVGVAKTMQSTYGSPFVMLTKAEGASLNAAFQKMTPADKETYLKAIAKNVTDPEGYQAIIQQIAPDSPVTAYAGVLMNKDYNPSASGLIFKSDTTMSGAQVARMLLEGEALLHPSKAVKEENGQGGEFPMPKKVDFDAKFYDQVGDSFAKNDQARQIAYQAVRAYYAAKSAREGNVKRNADSINSDWMSEAVNNVIGGISNVGGNGKVARPWGMDEATFNNALSASFHKKMTELGMADTAFDNMGIYRWINYREGQYMLENGGELRRDGSGAPIVVDIRDAQNMNGQGWKFPGLQMQRAAEANSVLGTLTTQERNLVQYHENNLINGTTGRDDQGRPISVYSTTIQIPEGEKGAGKFVTVPGYVVDQPKLEGYRLPDIGLHMGGPGQPAIVFGKPNNPAAPGPTGRIIGNDAELYDRYKGEIQAGKWPVYDTAALANQRAQLIHQVMDYDAGNPITPGAQLPAIPMRGGKAPTLPSGAGMPRK